LHFLWIRNKTRFCLNGLFVQSESFNLFMPCPIESWLIPNSHTCKFIWKLIKTMGQGKVTTLLIVYYYAFEVHIFWLKFKTYSFQHIDLIVRHHFIISISYHLQSQSLNLLVIALVVTGWSTIKHRLQISFPVQCWCSMPLLSNVYTH